MKEFFKAWNPQEEGRRIIEFLDEISEEYERLGYRLTSRQAYYRLVGMDVIGNVTEQYKAITRYIDRGKRAGLLDWSLFEDRTRIVEGKTTSPPYHGPYVVDIRGAVEREIETCYASDIWAGQPYYVEVYVEKSALIEIIGRVAEEYEVAYMAVRGFSGDQVLKEAADRFKRRENDGRKGILLYVGDCDPSGVIMSGDIQRRLSRFRCDAEVKRIALNVEQVQQFNLPENPVKKSDTRSAAYIKKYGNGCWEVDALEPRVLDEIVRAGILEYFDEDIREANIPR
jgi:hypothetical protein